MYTPRLLRAIQMGMNQFHGHRSLGRSQNQVSSDRHLRQGRSIKENRQNCRGLPHQPSGHRNLFENRDGHVDKSSRNDQSLIQPYDNEDDYPSFHQPPQPLTRLGRQGSIILARSDRRHLVRDFDHNGRFRQIGAMTIP